MDGGSQDCWTTRTKSVDVHYSSGPANHFFYLLSEGSGAKTINGIAYNSPTCNGTTITGIGRAQAAAIWYRALTVYMTSSTTYSGAKVATTNAATDLYGATLHPGGRRQGRLGGGRGQVVPAPPGCTARQPVDGRSPPRGRPSASARRRAKLPPGRIMVTAVRH